jgi:hypothetical protein
MQKCIEATDEFVVSRSKAAKLLESIEETLNQISGLVSMPIDSALSLAIGAGRDDV